MILLKHFILVNSDISRLDTIERRALTDTSTLTTVISIITALLHYTV